MLKLDTSCPAGLELCQVVLLSHSIDETSEKVGHLFEDTVLLKLSQVRSAWRIWNCLHGSEGKRHSVCNISSSLEVAASGPVSLLSLDVLLDGSLVDQVVLSYSLNESWNVLELSSPSCNRGKVVREVVASGGVDLEVEEDLLEFFDSLDEVEVLEVAEDSLDTFDDWLRACVASFNF